jgi:murein DD-endopeptidase MepM/ murein hydrolase activator NlpD
MAASGSPGRLSNCFPANAPHPGGAVVHALSQLGVRAALRGELASLDVKIRSLRQRRGAASDQLEVTSPYGARWGRMHEGVDIAALSGRPISAASSGRVICAGWMDGYGNLGVIDHAGGITTAYAHHSAIAAAVGQSVGRGQTIGDVGSTGNSTGAHLHFEVRANAPTSVRMFAWTIAANSCVSTCPVLKSSAAAGSFRRPLSPRRLAPRRSVTRPA